MNRARLKSCSPFWIRGEKLASNHLNMDREWQISWNQTDASDKNFVSSAGVY